MTKGGSVDMRALRSRLRNLLYSALLGESTWERFLGQLAKTMPNGKAALVVHDTSTNDGYALVNAGEEQFANEYNAYYGRLSPLQPPLALKRIGVAAHDHELLPRRELVETEFHNDFLVRHGLAYCAGVKIARAGRLSFTLVTSCGDDGMERLMESVSTLNYLAPHLKRAVEYHRRGPLSHAASALERTLFDSANIGIVVIGDQRRVERLSPTARAMLENPSPLRIAANGLIRFRRADIHAVFERMLRRGYTGPRSLDFLSHQTKLTLVQVDSDVVSTYFNGPTVIAFLKQLGDRPLRYDLQLFSDAYRLSMGEVRALSGIVTGLSLDEISAGASLSRETIRSQVRSLYAKTGAASAADVLRLVHRRCHA